LKCLPETNALVGRPVQSRLIIVDKDSNLPKRGAPDGNFSQVDSSLTNKQTKTRPERPNVYKHSSFFGPFINDKEKKTYMILPKVAMI
jgi:hypothetical protein